MTLIRVIKRPPAPVMDGFAVGDLKPGRMYEASDAMAAYLMVAGYAIPALQVADDKPRRDKDKKEDPIR